MQPDRARKRVCLIRHSHYPKDPRDRRQVEALLDHGYQVDVICLRARGEHPYERLGDLALHRLPVQHRRSGVARYFVEYLAFFCLATAQVSRLHARRRYHVVQVSTMPDFLVFAAVVPKLMGARIVLDFHEAMPELFATKFGSGRARLFPRALEVVEHVSTRFADRVVVVSEPHKAAVMRRHVPERKLELVMNSPDERYFRPRRRPRPSPDGGPLLVAHGSLLDHYGFQTVIRAMPAVRHFAPAARLHVIGEGEYEHALRALARQLSIDDRVEFKGFVPLHEIPAQLAAADIGVVPNEGPYFRQLVLPTKLMELVAMGVPSVVARSDAVLAYFDASMVCFFEAGDDEDLARAVAELVADPSEARAMARRAAEGFLPTHEWPRMKEVYLEMIGRLASVSDED